MSKSVKELVRKELINRFQGLTSLAVVDLTGIDANMTHRIRARLRAKDIHVTVVKNSPARQALKEVGLAAAAQLLDGPSAIAYAKDSEDMEVVTLIRELLDLGKEAPNLTVKAALLEGEAFGPDRIDKLSKYPTRPEAQAQVVAALLSVGRNLAGCLVGPGTTLASVVKTIQDNHQADEAEAA